MDELLNAMSAIFNETDTTIQESTDLLETETEVYTNLDNEEVPLPIMVLRHELESEHLDHRVEAIKKISTIALALGEELTRSKLLAYIMEIRFEDTEVLLVLAKQIGNLLDYIGGPEYAMYLIPPLEYLARNNNPHVRDTACDVLIKVAEAHSATDFEAYIIPTLHRLVNSTAYTARMSATSLFEILCEDTSEMVRAAASNKLHSFAQVIEPQLYVTEVLPMFLINASDTDSSVRLMCACNLLDFLQLFTQQENEQNMFAYVKIFASDADWRVRFVIAERIVDFQKLFTADNTRTELMQIVEYFLKDEKELVRVCILEMINEFCLNLSNDMNINIIIATILPHLKNLLNDEHIDVKCAACNAVIEFSNNLGGFGTFEQLLPLITPFFHSDSAEIHEVLINGLPTLSKVIGADKLFNIVYALFIKDYAMDSNWRKRLSTMNYIPVLAKEIGEQKFNQPLLPLFNNWLNDQVYTIRESVLYNIKTIGEIFGTTWLINNILPMIQGLCDHQYYLRRITCLHFMNINLELFDKQSINDHLMPMVFKLVADKTANVRQNAVKTLMLLIPHLANTEAHIKRQIKAILQQLSYEQDLEVKEQAEQALKMCLEW